MKNALLFTVVSLTSISPFTTTFCTTNQPSNFDKTAQQNSNSTKEQSCWSSLGSFLASLFDNSESTMSVAKQETKPELSTEEIQEKEFDSFYTDVMNLIDKNESLKKAIANAVAKRDSNRHEYLNLLMNNKELRNIIINEAYCGIKSLAGNYIGAQSRLKDHLVDLSNAIYNKEQTFPLRYNIPMLHWLIIFRDAIYKTEHSTY